MNDGQLAQRQATGIRRVAWGAVASLAAALVAALPTVVLPAMAATPFTMEPAAVRAEVGTHFSKYETYTADFAPQFITVLPTAQAGVSFETSTLLLAGTPERSGTLEFQVVASDGVTTETATISVNVVCPTPIHVTPATADACLPQYPEVPLNPPAPPSPGRLRVVAAAFGPMVVSLPATRGGGDPHIAYNTQADGCAACHRMHADGSETFNPMTATSHSADCLSCHDGSGATSNVVAEYAAAGVNDAATRSYYRHDALAVNTGHMAASSDDEGGSVASNEFQGRSNRHSDCVDCHNPHAVSTSPNAAQGVVAGAGTGWSVSGRLQSVSVATAAADTSTAFVGHATTAANDEYQLCMKCHSDFTVLGANTPGTPSRDWLDKSAEIDPATPGNASFHPIMAPGTNATTAMAASLSGSSAYKLWTFTVNDTVRCGHCHANGAVAGTPGQSLATHGSANRGILIRPYRDRLLLTTAEAGSTSRFALCFTCHTDVPFNTQTSTGTAFRYHQKHFSGISGKGSYLGGSIDTDGAGNGDAVCAECHFRLHSTVNKVAGQNVDGSRLVNFAPNVQPSGGTIGWTKRNGQTAGTCTLICHGENHQNVAY